MGEYLGMFGLYVLVQLILFFVLFQFIGPLITSVILLILITSYIFVWFHILLDELRGRKVE